MSVWVCLMTAPIRDSQGLVIGAIAGLTNLGRLNFLDKISTYRYGKTGSYFLIAPRWRLIITGSDPSSRMGTLPAPGVSPWADPGTEGYEGSAIYIASNGVPVLSSVKHIPAANWYLMATVPTAEAIAPSHAMQERRLLAAAFLSLLVVLLTWFSPSPGRTKSAIWLVVSTPCYKLWRNAKNHYLPIKST